MGDDVKPQAVALGERALGREVVSWERIVSRGYSVAEHWRLELADGSTAFAKGGVAVGRIAESLRTEHALYARLVAPFLPRLLGWVDGELPVLVLEDLGDAEWPPPWTPALVDAVLTTLDEVAATRAPDGLPPVEETYGRGWDEVAADPEPLLSLDLCSRGWLDETLPALRAAEAATPLAGDALVHCDVRSDNLCVRDGRAVLVDWNLACRGNPDFDVAFWLPSLVLEDGPPVAEIAERRPGVDDFAAWVAGFFACRAGLPPPDGAPAVRAFQLAQLEVALPWAVGVLGLPSPDARIGA